MPDDERPIEEERVRREPDNNPNPILPEWPLEGTNLDDPGDLAKFAEESQAEFIQNMPNPSPPAPPVVEEVVSDTQSTLPLSNIPDGVPEESPVNFPDYRHKVENIGEGDGRLYASFTDAFPNAGDDPQADPNGTKNGWLKFRSIKAGAGVTVEVDGDDVLVSAVATNPWTVTPNGDDTVSVAEGALTWLQPTPNSVGAAHPNMHSYEVVDAVASLPITGDGYVCVDYALSANTVYTQQSAFSDGGDLFTEVFGELSSAPTVFFTTVRPSPADFFDVAGSIRLVIAEVALVGGVASLTRQILSHNPIIGVPAATKG